MRPEDLRVIVATDCGSTTTKAILIELKEDGYRQTYRGEAPTTVESPFEDVTRGVLNAFTELEELSGRKILDGERIITPASGNVGVDIYVSTSSAGGGLQMMVGGVVKSMTAESAQRAAPGAGAIVMDVIASNDQRAAHEKIERIRTLRPDMILLSGGTDGGTVRHVVELAEFIAAANPRPRLGSSFKLPIVYAGNKDARESVQAALGEKAEIHMADNLRPVLERENLGPARHEIHELFLKHVMAQAPGYPKLMTWVGAPIMPTPAAVGNIIQHVAKTRNLNIVGVDIGGATTDVFSDYVVPEETARATGIPSGQRIFNRTVSANLGMSYSISNVLAETGLANIMRWVPFEIDESDLRNRIKNKMIRPTTIPCLLEDLKVEQAIARGAAAGVRAAQGAGGGPQGHAARADDLRIAGRNHQRRQPDRHAAAGPVDRVGRGALARPAALPGDDDGHRRVRAGRADADRGGQHLHDAAPGRAGAGERARGHAGLRARLPDPPGHVHLAAQSGQARRQVLRLRNDRRRADPPRQRAGG